METEGKSNGGERKRAEVKAGVAVAQGFEDGGHLEGGHNSGHVIWSVFDDAPLNCIVF